MHTANRGTNGASGFTGPPTPPAPTTEGDAEARSPESPIAASEATSVQVANTRPGSVDTFERPSQPSPRPKRAPPDYREQLINLPVIGHIRNDIIDTCEQPEADGSAGVLAAESNVDSEAPVARSYLDFLTEDIAGTDNLSATGLLAILLGPISIVSNALGFKKGKGKATADRALNSQLEGSALDQSYHKKKRNVAGLKAVLDTVRYVSILVLIGGASALAAPLVALCATAVRWGVGAYEAITTMNKKAKRQESRKNQKIEIQKTIEQCPEESQQLINSRIDYKLKKNWWKSSRVLTAIKTLAHIAGSVVAIAMVATAAAAGTLLVLSPFVFGPIMSVFAILVVVLIAENAYEGFHRRAYCIDSLQNDQTLVSQRIERITGAESGILTKIGASLNILGWITDFIDDRTRRAHPIVKGTLRILFLPFFLIAWLTQSKKTNETMTFNELKTHYLAAAGQERQALLETVSSYYRMAKTDVLTKWMSPDELESLERYGTAEPTGAPTSPLVQDWLTHSESPRLDKTRALLLSDLNPKFGGEPYAATQIRHP